MTATSSVTASATQTGTNVTPSPLPTPTVSPSCAPAHYQPLPRTDLVGTPLGEAPLATASESACRWACCGVPACDGYAFALTELRWGPTASCFLYAGVTATAPNSGYASGLRAGVELPARAPASATPAQTRVPVRVTQPARGSSVTPSATSAPTVGHYCAPSLFRPLPRMDLVGTLVGTALTPGALALTPSLEACRQACCDAPACDGFSFAVSELAISPTGVAGCFLYVNVTQLIPSSVISSGLYESSL